MKKRCGTRSSRCGGCRRRLYTPRIICRQLWPVSLPHTWSMCVVQCANICLFFTSTSIGPHLGGNSGLAIVLPLRCTYFYVSDVKKTATAERGTVREVENTPFLQELPRKQETFQLTIETQKQLTRHNTNTHETCRARQAPHYSFISFLITLHTYS